MKQSIFFYKELTPAELGIGGIHEVYVRFPNNFDYDAFFCNSAIQNGTVKEVNFMATDLTNGASQKLIPLRFVYFEQSNQEKRVPSLSTLFQSHNVEVGDIVCFESRIENGVPSYFIQFYKKDTVKINPSSIYFIKPVTEKEHTQEDKIKANNAILQQIFYGAPGTGKSHEIKEKTKGESVVRTTFHPDSDYSTFVGSYKPTSVDVPVMTIIGKDQVPVVNAKPEKKIVYKFIPQAFLKAYLGAWKKYADWKSPTTSNQKKKITFSTKIGGDYVILSVGDSSLKFSRSFDFTKKAVAKEWPKLWNNDLFSIPNGPQSGASVQHAIALWIKNNISPCTQNDFEKGWDAMMDKIRTEGSVEASKQQTYIITNIEGTTNKIRVKVEEAGKSKDSLKNVFNGSPSQFELENKLVEILKQYSATSFDEAWEQLKEDVETGTQTNLAITYKPQFLVIEEINRGNCAQIFGDLFQLLDRGDNGFSEYPIEADSDLQQEIERAFKEGEYKLANDINIEGEIEGYTSNYGATLSKDVQSGRVLLLPKNLYIWATMNTSDQSLFPIDSAFKRRWDWKYLPIENAEKGWEILVNNNRYDWYKFLEAINKEVLTLTHSEDKQLGYFFAKAKDGVIDAKTLVNKVYFYLWNDVFKDYEYESQNAFKDPNKNKSIAFKDFFKSGQELDEGMAEQILLNLKLDKPEESAE